VYEAFLGWLGEAPVEEFVDGLVITRYGSASAED